VESNQSKAHTTTTSYIKLSSHPKAQKKEELREVKKLTEVPKKYTRITIFFTFSCNKAK